MKHDDMLNKYFKDDPFMLLGVSRDAGDNEIQKAYKCKIKSENDPQKREQLKSAIELIETEQKRIIYNLFSPAPVKNINEIERCISSGPKYVGPGFWMKIIAAGSKNSYN